MDLATLIQTDPEIIAVRADHIALVPGHLNLAPGKYTAAVVVFSDDYDDGLRIEPDLQLRFKVF